MKRARAEGQGEGVGEQGKRERQNNEANQDPAGEGQTEGAEDESDAGKEAAECEKRVVSYYAREPGQEL